jgi:hypothetical protein
MILQTERWFELSMLAFSMAATLAGDTGAMPHCAGAKNGHGLR